MTTVSNSAASARRGIRPLAEEDLGLAVERLGDRLQLRRRLSEVDQLDVGAAQSGHLAPLALVRRVDRMEPETRGEHPVEGRRGAAPLDMTQHGGPSLVTGSMLDLALEPVGDPAEADMAESIGRGTVARRHPALRQGSLGHDDDRRVVALEALHDVLADPVEVELDLGD